MLPGAAVRPVLSVAIAASEECAAALLIAVLSALLCEGEAELAVETAEVEASAEAGTVLVSGGGAIDDEEIAAGATTLSLFFEVAPARAAAGAVAASAVPVAEEYVSATAEDFCADSAALEGAGRAAFGRGAVRLVEAVEEEDDAGAAADAGRLSLSLDLDTFPLLCLSGQRAWQQARALSKTKKHAHTRRSGLAIYNIFV